MSYTKLKTELSYALTHLETVVTNAKNRQPPADAAQLRDYNHDLLADMTRLDDNIQQMEKIQDNLDTLYESCNNPDTIAKLEALAVGTSKIPGYVQILHEARNLYTDVKIQQQKIQDKITSAAVATSAPSPVPTSSVLATSYHRELFLPKIQYERFNGDPKKWNYFYSRFSTVDNSILITPADKLNLLVGLCDGPAKAALAQYTICDKNYPLAMEDLKKKFGNDGDIINLLNDEFYALIGSGDGSVRVAKKLYETFESILGQLDALGEDSNNSGLRTWWLKQMPSFITEPCLLHLGMHARLTDLRRHAGTVLEVKERCQPEREIPSKVNFAKKSGFQQNNKPNSSRQPEAARTSDHQHNHKSDKNYSNRPRKECLFCGDSSHSSASCPAYVSVDSRRDRLRELKRCTTCCKSGHRSNECNYSQRCYCCNKTNHAYSLCYERAKKRGKTSRSNVAAVETAEAVTVTTTAATVRTEDVVLPITKAFIANPIEMQFQNTPMLLDCGSMLSYIDLKHATHLNLQEIDREILHLETFNNETLRTVHAPVYEIVVQCTDDVVQRIYVRGVDRITDELIMASKRTDEVKVLFEVVKPLVLIGSDYFYKFMDCEELPSGYFLVRTRLGNVVCGPGPGVHRIPSNVKAFSVNAKYRNPDETSERVLEQHIQLDVGGLNGDPNLPEKELAIQHFKRTYRRDSDGSFIVRHFWKTDSPQLKTNFSLAFNRLRTTMARLQKSGRSAIYMKPFHEHRDRGFIEKVPDGLRRDPDRLVHILAHHAVEKDSPTTPIRPVFDCSAVQRPNDLSLNDNLYTCAPSMPDLIGLNIVFRSYPIVISADIEKAFMAMKLHEADRDVFRFLLPKDPEKPVTMNNIEVWRYTRPLFGAGPSPFQLEQCIRELLEPEPDPVASELLRTMFVDNSLLGAFSPEEGIHKAETSHRLFQKANMNLRNHISNCQTISDHMDTTVPEITSFLGTKWKPAEDIIFISVPLPKDVKVITKRKVLSFVASAFDPMGLLAPVIFDGKVFIQTLWVKNKKWDDALDDDDVKFWKQYLLANAGKEVELQRYVLSVKAVARQLHVFVDASEKGIAACAYVRETLPDDSFRSNLIISKTRVAPAKYATIPKLELMGAALGAALMKFVHKEFPFPLVSSTLWTDSTCVLGWLNSREKLGRFIENRKNFIFESSSVVKHVRSADNPADIASRGCSMSELVATTLWWHGPPWLQQNESLWPPPAVNHVNRPTPIRSSPSLERINEEPEIEEINSSYAATALTVNSVTEKADDTATPAPASSTDTDPIQFPLETERFSNWTSLLGATAAILYFIKCCGKKFTSIFMQKLVELIVHKYYDPKMIYFAEKFVIMHIQKKFPPSQSVQRALKLRYNEDGLLVCDHRIPSSIAPPLIWLPACRETNLLILHIHKQLNHAGPRHTLNEIRAKYWICKGKQMVNKVLRNDCYHCRRLKAKPYQLPDMPTLPRERVEVAFPYKFTGIDYAGPFLIKNNEVTEKVWICLFTCMVTRNVHLELCKNLDGNSFVLAFRRFVARCSTPSVIWSDHGTNFQAAKKFIEPAWNIENSTINELIRQHKLTWNFITEKSPWKGGFWERLIGILKINIRHAVGRSVLKLDEFQTLITEIETIINTRPISAVDPEYHEDGAIALRPIDFHAPQVHPTFPLLDDNDDDPEFVVQKTTEATLHELYHRTSKQRCRFWSKFYRDYLNQLREQMRHYHRQAKVTAIAPKIGSVVLVEAENQTINEWRLAIIVGLNISNDHEIRSAQIQTGTGRILTRPLSQLYPLEITLNDSEAFVTHTASTSDDTSSQPENSKRYSLRRRPTTSLFVLGVIFCLIVGTNALECQSSTHNLKLVYAENCMNNGLVIFERSDGTFCHENVDCGPNHLFNGTHDVKNPVLCSDPCQCPEWSDDCTFYSRTVTSSDKAAYLKLIDDEAVRPGDSVLFIIALHDDSQHVIRQLQLVKNDVLDETICFGHGDLVNGSPLFCRNTTCVPEAKKFCHYNHHQDVQVIVHNGVIPIKAWKTVLKPLEEHPIAIQPRLPISCEDGHITLNSTENIRRVQLQTGTSYMVFQPNSSQLVMQIPTALVTATRDFSVTYWNKNEALNTSHVTCEPVDYCLRITPCWFCLEELENPECRPMKVLLLFSNLISFMYIIIHKFYKVCKRRRLQRRESSSNLSEIKISKRKHSDDNVFVRLRKLSAAAVHQTTIQIGVIVFIALLPIGARADLTDSETIVDSMILSAKSQQCTVNANGWVNCKVFELAQLTTSSMKPSTLLINYENRPMGSIKIAPEVHLMCQKNTHHFTRIIHAKTASVRICGGRSFCTGYECAQATQQIRVPALGRANELPGNTYCQETCGGWSCSCLTWGSACLYYRNFAIEADPRPMEIFSCDGYRTVLRLNVTITTQKSVTNRLLTLHEGQSMEFSKVKFGVLDINPESSVVPQSQVFINTGKTIARLNDVGTSAANVFVCDDRDAATKFENCSLHESCHCVPADGIANCACLENTVLLKLLNENALPLLVHDQWLQPTEDGNVVSTIPAHPRLQVEIQGFSLYSSIDMNSCNAIVHKLEGCSSCTEGAIAHITCSTDFAQAEAHVTCPAASFPLSCSKEGKFQKVTLYLNSVNVDQNCTLRCPSNAVPLHIHGIVRKSTFTNKWSKITTEVQQDKSLLLALVNGASELIQSSYKWLIITIGFVGFVTLLILYLFHRYF